MTTYQEIPLDQIHPDPNQPRRVFDLEALAELADSIREHGVLQPIAVYPNGNGYIIKHGERRWRASKLASQPTIPVIIAKAPDALTRKIQQFVENDQREAMNVIDTALFYQSMLDEGLSMMELSRKLGRGGQTTFITNALVWLELEDEIQTAVAAKRLPKDARVARALLEIPNKQARVKMGVSLASRNASIQSCVSAAKKLAKTLSSKESVSKVRTPAITLGLNGNSPKNGRVSWKATRQAAQTMCDTCSLKGLTGREEPAWTLVLQATEKTCDDCTARNGRDLTMCQECPGVEIVKLLAQAVTA